MTSVLILFNCGFSLLSVGGTVAFDISMMITFMLWIDFSQIRCYECWEKLFIGKKSSDLSLSAQGCGLGECVYSSWLLGLKPEGYPGGCWLLILSKAYLGVQGSC